MLLHTHSTKRENALHITHVLQLHPDEASSLCASYTSVEKLCIEDTVTGPLPLVMIL